MYSEDQVVINLLSTFVTSTSTVANATIDMGPYFNVMRREIAMVWFNGISSTSTEGVSFRLEEADSTATANSTAVTFSGIAGSSVTSTALGASLVTYPLTTVQPLSLTKRYLRAAAVGTAATAVIPISIGVVLIRRGAM